MEKPKIPGWMLESQGSLLAPGMTGGGLKGRKLRLDFVEKTLEDLSGLILDGFYAERIAGKPGLLQGIQPGFKIVTTLLLIGVAAGLHHWLILIILNMWVLSLAYYSGISVPSFMKRVWLVVPLFTGIIILPSLFNFVRPGTPLLVLLNFDHPLRLGPWILPSSLAITSQGVWGALVFILRVGACVSLTLLLTLTTQWPTLLKSFNMVFVPQIFTTVLEMTYRYIYVFLDIVRDVFMARKSRTVGRTSTKEQRRFISGAIGALMGRAVILSEEVHSAMVARGYTGKQRSLEGYRARRFDWLWACLVLVVSAILLWGDWTIGI